MILAAADYTGAATVRAARLGLGLLELTYAALKSLFVEHGRGRKLFRKLLRRQIYFTGTLALPIIFVTALVFGVTFFVPIVFALSRAGMTDWTWPLIVFTLVRQFSPILLAIIVIARSGAAVATEIGYMKLNNELAALDAMGVNTDYIIVLPRLLGITIATVVLFVAFNTFAVLAGYFVSRAALMEAKFLDLALLFKTFHFLDLLEGIIKAGCFGAVIALVSVYQGFTLKRAISEIPQIATRGVVQSILICFVLDFIITFLFLLGRGQ